MATKTYIKPRKHYRIRYRLGSRGNSEAVNRFFKKDPEANKFLKAISVVENAARMGQARKEDIERWIRLDFVTTEQAVRYFDAPGLALVTTTDYDALSKAYDVVIDASTRNHASYSAKRSRADRVIDWLKRNVDDLSVLTKKQVEGWATELGKKYAKKTVFHFVTEMRLLLDTAMDLHMTQVNAARLIKAPQPKRADTPRRRFKPAETKKIFGALESNKDGVADLMGGAMEACCFLGYFCGLRNSEIQNLVWDNVDFGARLVRIKETVLPDGTKWETKTETNRVIGMSGHLVEYLKVWKVRQDGGTFVIGGTSNGVDRPYHKDALTQAWPVLREAAKLKEDTTFYCFRHTYAREELKRVGTGEKDMADLQAEMGHADMTTTMLYLHDEKDETNKNDSKGFIFE
jgi:integrase|tara:strand:+ start:8122 stop:9330 length:1209 start_codon:yes stop_codon:yes gene_type:complete